MICDRNFCENDATRCSEEYGCICDDCFEELIYSGVNTDIAIFMNGHNKNKYKKATRIYFNAIFEEIN